MRNAVIISGALHLAVFAAAWISNPFSARAPLDLDQAIAVEVALFAETPTPPLPKKPLPKAPPKPPPPIAKKIIPPAKPPPPVPDLAPKAEVNPPPVPKPKKVAALPPKEIPAPKRTPPPKPVAKPSPPDDFSSVLKTVENLKNKAPQEKPKPVKTLAQEVAEALKRHKTPSQKKLARLGGSLTMSERDSVRRQIEPCWNVPAGARDAENLVVNIRLRLNSDGTVFTAELVDSARAARDPFFRAAAESALRAVLNPRCSPLRLPPKKYEEWKNMVLSFNPRDMF